MSSLNPIIFSVSGNVPARLIEALVQVGLSDAWVANSLRDLAGLSGRQGTRRLAIFVWDELTTGTAELFAAAAKVFARPIGLVPLLFVDESLEARALHLQQRVAPLQFLIDSEGQDLVWQLIAAMDRCESKPRHDQPAPPTSSALVTTVIPGATTPTRAEETASTASGVPGPPTSGNLSPANSSAWVRRRARKKRRADS